MNEILQKRIEEAAKKYADKAVRYIDDSEEDMIKVMVNFTEQMLSDQWISVEEALPEKEGRYLCNYHYTMSNSDEECDCVDFGLFKDGKWYIANNEVTHWAETPKFYK